MFKIFEFLWRFYYFLCSFLFRDKPNRQLKDLGIDIGPNKIFIDKNKFNFSFDRKSNQTMNELLNHDANLINYNYALLSEIVHNWSPVNLAFSEARRENKLYSKLDKDKIWNTSIKVYGDCSRVSMKDIKKTVTEIIERSHYL